MVLEVLLVRRAEEPHKGKWALPGGVLRIDKDASLDEAALRVAHERLGVEVPFMRQLCAVGGPARTSGPRGPSASFIGRWFQQSGSSHQRASGSRPWRRPVEAASSDNGLAFDHAELVAKAVDATRAEVERLELPFGFLPMEFTLGELQATCEQLLGRWLDKSSLAIRN